MGKKKQSDEQPDPVKERLARLMAHLRSQMNGRSVVAFANYLNQNLPESQHFAPETVRRWEKGKQTPSADKVELLARSLGIEFGDLNAYLQGDSPWENLLVQMQLAEIPMDETQAVREVIRLIRKLSPTLLIEVMSKAWEILQEKLQSVTLVPNHNNKTIAKLVQSEIEKYKKVIKTAGIQLQ